MHGKTVVGAIGLLAAALLVNLTTPRESMAEKPLDVQVISPLPLPVRPVSSQQVVQLHSKCTMEPGFPGCDGEGSPYTVPAGKRLVINYFSVQAHLPAGQAVSAVLGRPSDFLYGIGNYLPLSPLAPGPNISNLENGSVTAVGVPVQILMDAGAIIGSRCIRTSVAGTARCRFAVNGYLEDAS